ncbi:hypothetical protein I2485_09710 [Nesterenkonia sp. E16_7]|uniref:hypothetical protein n=1 Tax=unclassified Nesterenkonia TaxID=2629769 RepID=UPI001A9190EF|nr:MULTISPECIES: hypothetical protein [unclassified Nesterenkonia]MBO0595200.1 hypothetical protein [Nesterenkonia sp. E16_10]MBO0598919.1 hypothetical protein [Nesterenkonia sp. E16_7]
MNIRHQLPVLIIAITALIGISGCSSPADQYSDLTEDRDSNKPLPDTIRGQAVDTLDPESTRWVGEHEGTELWLGVELEGAGTCLVVYPDDERWVTGCSSGNEVSLSNGDGWDYRVRPDSAELPEGAIQVSHNVFVTKR